MIHEIILVLAGFRSSVISTDSTLISDDDSSVLHPSEQTLLARVARFGELHRTIIDAVEYFEYNTSQYSFSGNTANGGGNNNNNNNKSNNENSNLNNNNGSRNNHRNSINQTNNTNSDPNGNPKPEIPKSYVLTRSAIVSVIEVHALKALSKELETIEAEILQKDSKYVGGNNTVAVSQIVGKIISKWHRVLQFSKYILQVLDILPVVDENSPDEEGNISNGGEPRTGLRNINNNTSQSAPTNYNEIELLSSLYTLSSDSKYGLYQTKKNIFKLFTNLIGYPEVDEIRNRCLLVVHRLWLQFVSSWLLYGHISVASSAFENMFDESEQHKLVEYLLVNKTQETSGPDNDIQNNDKYDKLEQAALDYLFLPPGVTSEMGYLIYTTGNMVRIFVGVSSYGTSKSSSLLGKESRNLFQNLHSSSASHFAFSRPSTSSSSVSGVSINTSSISYIPTHTLVDKYVQQISTLKLPIDPYPLLDVVTSLRSDVLKAIGTTEFSKPKVWSYFYTLRRIVLAGDAGFNTIFTDKLLQAKEEADAKASAKFNHSRHKFSNSANTDLSYYENIYEPEGEEIGMDEQDNNNSIRSSNNFLYSQEVAPDMTLKRVAPETLRQALMTISEGLDECDDETLSKMIENVQKDALQFKRKNTSIAFITNKCFQTKQMYTDAATFLELVVLDPEASTNNSRSNSRAFFHNNNTINSDRFGNVGQRSGTDIFKTTFLGISTQLNFKLNWFQATLTKLPELDCAKYSILFSFLMSLNLSHQMLTTQWKNVVFKRGAYFRGAEQYRAAEKAGDVDIKQPFEHLLQAVQYTRVFLTEICDYFQVTVIDQSFSKLLNKCFPQSNTSSNSNSRNNTSSLNGLRYSDRPASAVFVDFNGQPGLSDSNVEAQHTSSQNEEQGSQAPRCADTDVEMNEDGYQDEDSDTIDDVISEDADTVFVEPDMIAQFHQDFISEVYDTIFLDSDTLSYEFLSLVITIKNVCAWLDRNHIPVMTHTIRTIKSQEEIVMEMQKHIKNLYQHLERIVQEIETIQQSDDEAATKYPLHFLLLRLEFVRERRFTNEQYNSHDDKDMVL